VSNSPFIFGNDPVQRLLNPIIRQLFRLIDLCFTHLLGSSQKESRRDVHILTDMMRSERDGVSRIIRDRGCGYS
jgi:hypothetical protein